MLKYAGNRQRLAFLSMQSRRRELMNDHIVQSRFGMPPGTLLRIDDGAGLLVQVLEGEVWMTEEGGADHVLGPGQAMRLNRGGAALGHALRTLLANLLAPVIGPGQIG
jgi:DUF2917 family protein